MISGLAVGILLLIFAIFAIYVIGETLPEDSFTSDSSISFDIDLSFTSIRDFIIDLISSGKNIDDESRFTAEKTHVLGAILGLVDIIFDFGFVAYLGGFKNFGFAATLLFVAAFMLLGTIAAGFISPLLAVLMGVFSTAVAVLGMLYCITSFGQSFDPFESLLWIGALILDFIITVASIIVIYSYY